MFLQLVWGAAIKTKSTKYKIYSILNEFYKHIQTWGGKWTKNLRYLNLEKLHVINWSRTAPILTYATVYLTLSKEMEVGKNWWLSSAWLWLPCVLTWESSHVGWTRRGWTWCPGGGWRVTGENCGQGHWPVVLGVSWPARQASALWVKNTEMRIKKGCSYCDSGLNVPNRTLFADKCQLIKKRGLCSLKMRGWRNINKGSTAI